METWELGWTWAWTWLGRVADVASLVALPVSVYAAWKVRLIAKRLVFRVRAADILSKIVLETQNLRNAMDDVPAGWRDAQL